MTDMPETIWAGIEDNYFRSLEHGYGEWSVNPSEVAGGAVKYTRTDIAQAEIDALRAKVDRMEKALTWYSDHFAISKKVTIDSVWAKQRLHDDGGKLARAALQEGKE